MARINRVLCDVCGEDMNLFLSHMKTPSSQHVMSQFNLTEMFPKTETVNHGRVVTVDYTHNADLCVDCVWKVLHHSTRLKLDELRIPY